MVDRRVDAYLAGLPRWAEEFAALRAVLLTTDLTEDLKWAKPCYTHDGENIVIFQPFKRMCALMFFKGALLDDPDGVLRAQGEASRSSRRLELRSLDEVSRLTPAIRDLVVDAIRVRRAGLRVVQSDVPGPCEYSEELTAALLADSRLAAAFERLTPGRRRGYLLHFSAAKRSQTRMARIERMRDRIMEGLGLHD